MVISDAGPLFYFIVGDTFPLVMFVLVVKLMQVCYGNFNMLSNILQWFGLASSNGFLR